MKINSEGAREPSAVAEPENVRSWPGFYKECSGRYREDVLDAAVPSLRITWGLVERLCFLPESHSAGLENVQA